MNNRMRTITLEEHFVTESFLRATGAYGSATPAWLEALQPQLLDLGAGRIAAMDAAGIDLQVLSLAAIGFDALDASAATSLASDVNDELAAAVRANPSRLAGFACLALKDPESAAKELERSIKKLGFCGVLLDGTTAGKFWTTLSSLPSLKRRLLSISRYTSTPRRLQRLFSIPISQGCQLGWAKCSPSPAGAGTQRPRSTHSA